MKRVPTDITAFVEEQYPLLIKILETDNPPDEEKALRKVVQKELTQLGFRTEVDETGNLLGFIGKGKDVLLLGGHLDSVMPCKGVTVVRKGTVIRSDGTTVLTADDGAGIFEVLTALRYIKKKMKKLPPIDVLFTVGEEIGGKGVKHLGTARLRARHGILLDRSAPPGTIVIAAPHKRNFSVVCAGIAAHALEAELGVSAIHIIAECVAKFPQGKLSESLSANIGKIRGGEAVNQVPEHAVIEGEVRSFTSLEADKLLEKYERIVNKIAEKYGCLEDGPPSIIFKYTDRREGYKHDPEMPLIRALIELHDTLGIKTNLQITRGCSDAGELNNKGIATVNYGYGGHQVHTRAEWIDLKDIAKVVWILTHVIERFGAGKIKL